LDLFKAKRRFFKKTVRDFKNNEVKDIQDTSIDFAFKKDVSKTAKIQETPTADLLKYRKEERVIEKKSGYDVNLRNAAITGAMIAGTTALVATPIVGVGLAATLAISPSTA